MQTRPVIAFVAAFAPLIAFVACETKPISIQRDRVCPSVAPAVVEPPHDAGHTTHHVCTGIRDDANREINRAVEAADSHCTTVAECVPLPIPPDCGLWRTCVPKLVAKKERRAFEVIDKLRAGACASWTNIGCNDYVDDAPACSYSTTPVCAKGTCSVEVKVLPCSSGP